jgi:glutathione S-transferase
MKITAPVVFKYLALPNGLGGRGGAQRFFMLANKIPFAEDLVSMGEWGSAEKARVVNSGENPSGTLPILYTASGETLTQHIASSRYLARIHDVTSDLTEYEEYVQDLVADEYQGFRDAWVKAAFTYTDDEKATFKETEIPKYLTKFEKLYAKYKTDKTYLSASMAGNPLWGDAAMFGLLRDNVITGFVDLDVLESSYPNLWTMYAAFARIEAVKEWINSKN